MLNPVKGNMYSFVTHTWNTVKGECPHNCAYCYMKRWGEQKPVRFDEKELKTDLGSGNFIFIGSSCDLFANAIPSEWIRKTLEYCRSFNNKYLFQSKNPAGIKPFMHYLPPSAIMGTTIETNRIYNEMGNPPTPRVRSRSMSKISRSFDTMVTVEPIMDFTLKTLVMLIKGCNPLWVNIGANTNHNVKLPEPKPEKVMELISALQEITEVKIKKNLKRLMC